MIRCLQIGSIYSRWRAAAVYVAVCVLMGVDAGLAVAASLGELGADDRVAELQATVVRIPEHLRACVNVRLGEFLHYQNVTVAKASIEVRKSIGECGCKSALLGYTAHSSETLANIAEKRGGTLPEMFQCSGRIGAISTREALIVVSSDAGARPVGNKLVIEFDCALPD